MTSLLEDLRFCESASALLDHWLSIKSDDQLCPLKKDFAPMQLKTALPDLFLAEQHNSNYAELRVVGSNIVDITGNDKTKANVYDICKPEHASTLRQLYGEVRSGKVSAVSEHIMINQFGRRIVKSLHLPLLSNDNEARFVVGVAKAFPFTMSHHDITSTSAAALLSQSLTNMSVVYTPLASTEAAG